MPRRVKQEVDVTKLAEGPVVRLDPIDEKEQLSETIVKKEQLSETVVKKERLPETVVKKERLPGGAAKIEPVATDPIKKEQLPEGAVKTESVTTDVIKKEFDPEPVKEEPTPRRGVKAEPRRGVKAELNFLEGQPRSEEAKAIRAPALPEEAEEMSAEAYWRLVCSTSFQIGAHGRVVKALAS